MSVSIENAVKRFDGFAAVNGVTVSIADGEFFVVLGASGCGKSTLLRLIAGLETLDEGSIVLSGTPVASQGIHVPPEERHVGVVFQSYALWPHMTVEENVAFPAEATGTARGPAAETAREHLATVALTGFEARRPAALSGGQRQRVALARCLAGGARTILMDEPLANLDPHLRAAMEEELARFHAASGATTLYITHDQREAMALADRAAVMSEGRFLQVGPPTEIYERPTSEVVARFIGRSALVEVTVLRVDGGRALVRVDDVEAECACPPGMKAGKARAVIRPGDVALAEPMERSALDGQVVSATYRGGVWEASVAVNGLAEPLPLSLSRRISTGDTVALGLHGGWLLPDAAGLTRATERPLLEAAAP